MRETTYGFCTLRVAGKYVCWNQYKSRFYLGSKANSEVFSAGLKWENGDYRNAPTLYLKTKRGMEAEALFPSARLENVSVS